jgi:hypothetical protein
MPRETSCHQSSQNQASTDCIFTGAYLLSTLEIDLTDYRDEFPVEPKWEAGPRAKVSSHVRVVEFDLVIIIEGRQLKYEARWPAGTTRPEDVRVRKRQYVSLAPSFAPGTA